MAATYKVINDAGNVFQSKETDDKTISLVDTVFRLFLWKLRQSNNKPYKKKSWFSHVETGLHLFNRIN